MRHFPWMVTLLLATAACEDISSTDLLTGGINAHIVGTARGTGQTEVVAVLKAGGGLSNTFVDLEGDDELSVTAGDQSATLVKRSLGVLHDYAATVDFDSPDETFAVAFDRLVDEGAPNSTFVLPDPFTLGAVADAMDPTTTLEVSWSPAEDGEIEVTIDGSCILTYTQDEGNDTGSASILGSNVETIEDEAGVSCPIEITVRRTLGGQLDPAFKEGGLVQGRQERTTT
ncbi:MAG: hypothetical protein ACI9MC_003103, partial [Kiritimatiellia bacterium]